MPCREIKDENRKEEKKSMPMMSKKEMLAKMKSMEKKK